MKDNWTVKDVLEHARELRSPFDKPQSSLSQAVNKLRGMVRKGKEK